jgi:hypothetical protein
MAKGYPDWFGQSIWPKYGTPLILGGTITVHSGEELPVIDQDGQGVLFSLAAEVDGISDLSDCVFGLYVDTTLLDYFTLKTVGGHFNSMFTTELIEIVLYDPITFVVNMRLLREVPFQSHVKFSCNNGSSGDLTFYAQGSYYKVT